MYAPNIGAPKYIKQILTNMKGEINNTTIVQYFTIPLSTMDRASRQKINKEMLDSIPDGSNRHIQNLPNKSGRIHILSSTQGIFSRRDHMLGHKLVLANVRK